LGGEFDGFGFDVFHVHHVIDKDLLDEFFLGHVSELVDTHQVSLGLVSVVLSDLVKVVLEDLESVGFLFDFVFFIVSELEVIEFDFVLVKFFGIDGFGLWGKVEDSQGSDDREGKENG
jgi:hypothetical protein